MIHEKKPPRLVTVLGTASSGKSTLVKAIKEIRSSDPRIVTVDQAARTYFLDNPQTLKQSVHVIEVQKPILELTLQAERIAIANPDAEVVIFDGSRFDSSLLTDYFGHKTDAQRLFARATEEIALADRYTLWALSDPTGVPFVKDGVRQETEEDRIAIHNLNLEFLQKNNLPFILICGALDERIRQLDGIISDLLLEEHTIYDRSLKQQELPA